MREKLVVSVSGKGGSGKTTVAALILKHLLEHSDRTILVVDADPSTNLPDVLGVHVEKTVGMVESEFRRKLDEGVIPPNVTKKELLEAWVYNVLVENPRFDLLAMGRSEGEGCYCSVNYLLTMIVDTLSKNYDVTLMDMEAGLEHLSRRTDRDVDIMLIVTDPSKMGLQTVARIKELTKEVNIQFKKMYVIGNQFPEDMVDTLQEHVEAFGLKLAGVIPADANVMRYNIAGQPLLELPEDAPSVKAMTRIVAEIGLLPT